SEPHLAHLGKYAVAEVNPNECHRKGNRQQQPHVGAKLAEPEVAQTPNEAHRHQSRRHGGSKLIHRHSDGIEIRGEGQARKRTERRADRERWRAEFVAMGKALGGGSGWVLLSWSPRGRKLVNQWASDHCHTLAGGTPILGLDMYEHSYQMDFGAKAGDYVDVFMSVINRPAVQQFYDRVRSLSTERCLS